MSDFFKALSVFVGTIVGVGIFGLPWVAFKSGFFVLLFYFLLVAGVTIAVHLLLAEVIVGTEGKHRFPGYVQIYLGRYWAKIAFIVMCLGLFGAQLAYLIVGGGFLAGLLAPFFGGSNLVYVLIFFALASFLIYKGIKSITLTEFLILLLFLGLLVFFSFKAAANIDAANFLTTNFQFFILPYGVVIFALWGSAILPEVKEVLKNKKRPLKKTIYWGIFIVCLIYLLFTLMTLGVSGLATSQDAFSGLIPFLGTGIAQFGFLFGVITCFSSFLTLGLTLKKIFLYDIGLSHQSSWLLAVFLPLILFLVGFKEFIEIIGLTGAVAVGLEGFIIVLLYRAYLKKKLSLTMNPAYFLLSLLFVLGVVAEVYYLFSGL